MAARYFSYGQIEGIISLLSVSDKVDNYLKEVKEELIERKFEHHEIKDFISAIDLLFFERTRSKEELSSQKKLSDVLIKGNYNRDDRLLFLVQKIYRIKVNDNDDDDSYDACDLFD